MEQRSYYLRASETDAGKILSILINCILPDLTSIIEDLEKKRQVRFTVIGTKWTLKIDGGTPFGDSSVNIPLEKSSYKSTLEAVEELREKYRNYGKAR